MTPLNSDAHSTESDRRIGLLLAALCGFCWSILAIGLKVALKFASSGTVVWFRMALAALILFIILGIKSRDNLKILWKMPLLGVIAALGLAANYIGFMKGIELTSPSHAQVFIQAAPLMLILVGVIWFREKPTLSQSFGFFLTLIGFYVFYRDQLSHALLDIARFQTGNIWIIFASITWVVFAALQKVLLKKWTPQQINLLLYLLSSFVLAPICDWDQFLVFDFGQWALMAALAINTVIAYGALGIALHKAPASQVSIILTLNPLITLALMSLLTFLQVSWIVPDAVSAQAWAGAAIVVSGVILAVRK